MKSASLNLTTVLNTCICMCVCVASLKTNLTWIKRNTSVTFVIKFSAMDITETDMKRLVYFISIRGNALRGDGTQCLGDQQGRLPQVDSSLKYDKDENKQDTVGFFTSRCVIKFPGEGKDMLNASIDQSYLKMFAACQEFQKEGSGWVVDEVLHLKLLIGKYQPLKGSQYFELPKKITKT